MIKCKICGKRFKLLKKNRYEVVKRPFGFDGLTHAPTYYNAFDCPRCGCQNIVGEIIKERNDEPVPKMEKPVKL